jgi:hypothetical protein
MPPYGEELFHWTNQWSNSAIYVSYLMMSKAMVEIASVDKEFRHSIAAGLCSSHRMVRSARMRAMKTAYPHNERVRTQVK